MICYFYSSHVSCCFQIFISIVTYLQLMFETFPTEDSIVGLGTAANVVVKVIAVSCFEIWLMTSDFILMVMSFDKLVA